MLRVLRHIGLRNKTSRTLHVRATRTRRRARVPSPTTGRDRPRDYCPIVAFRSAKGTCFRGAKDDNRRSNTAKPDSAVRLKVRRSARMNGRRVEQTTQEPVHHHSQTDPRSLVGQRHFRSHFPHPFDAYGIGNHELIGSIAQRHCDCSASRETEPRVQVGEIGS